MNLSSSIRSSIIFKHYEVVLRSKRLRTATLYPAAFNILNNKIAEKFLCIDISPKVLKRSPHGSLMYDTGHPTLVLLHPGGMGWGGR